MLFFILHFPRKHFPSMIQVPDEKNGNEGAEGPRKEQELIRILSQKNGQLRDRPSRKRGDKLVEDGCRCVTESDSEGGHMLVNGGVRENFVVDDKLVQ